MLSALTGLAVILLIALTAVVLGALTRLLAARILRPDPAERRELTVADRLALGNAAIARDLQPDSVRPIARTAERDGAPLRPAGAEQETELALRYYFPATHALR